MSDPHDVYEECLVASIKEFHSFNQIVPYKQLTEFNEELMKILLLDPNDPKVDRMFHATLEANDDIKKSKLTFSEETCNFQSGRWNFLHTKSYLLKNISCPLPRTCPEETCNFKSGMWKFLLPESDLLKDISCPLPSTCHPVPCYENAIISF